MNIPTIFFGTGMHRRKSGGCDPQKPDEDWRMFVAVAGILLFALAMMAVLLLIVRDR